MSHKFGFLLLTEAGWHWTVLGCWSYLSCGWQIWFCFLKRSILTHSFTSVYLEQWFHSKLSTLSITLWENPPTNRHTLTNKTKKQLKQMHNRAMLSIFPHKDLRFVFKIFVRDSDKMVKERMVTSSDKFKMGLWNGDNTSALPYSNEVCAFFILSFKWRKRVFCAFFSRVHFYYNPGDFP